MDYFVRSDRRRVIGVDALGTFGRVGVVGVVSISVAGMSVKGRREGNRAQSLEARGKSFYCRHPCHLVMPRRIPYLL